MLNNLNILDVSLRDGGYKNNFCFTKDEVKNIVNLLEKVGVDYIEVGYRNGTFKDVPNMGLTGLSNNEYLTYVKNLMETSKLAIMIHPKNVAISDICDFHSVVDFIRICVPKVIDEHTKNIIKKIKELNIQFSFNLTRISEYDRKTLEVRFKEILQYEPTIIYFADSNGHLTPSKTFDLCNHFVDSNIDLGFHAHNNLELALANSLAAVKAGVKYIDASIAGLGKGAGNLKLETLIGYFLSVGLNKYDFNQAMKSFQYMKNKPYCMSQRNYKDIIMGVLNYNQEMEGKVKIESLENLINSYMVK